MGSSKSKSLRCAYCPYQSYQHEHMVTHTLDHHSCQLMCYGCLARSYYSLKDLRRHLKKHHPTDDRAWGCYDYYLENSKRTFIYFSTDLMTGETKNYSFIAPNNVNPQNLEN